MRHDIGNQWPTPYYGGQFYGGYGYAMAAMQPPSMYGAGAGAGAGAAYGGYGAPQQQVNWMGCMS